MNLFVLELNYVKYNLLFNTGTNKVHHEFNYLYRKEKLMSQPNLPNITPNISINMVNKRSYREKEKAKRNLQILLVF